MRISIWISAAIILETSFTDCTFRHDFTSPLV